MSGKTIAMAAVLAVALMLSSLSAQGQNGANAAPFSPLSDKVEESGWLHVYINTEGAIEQFVARLSAYLASPNAHPAVRNLVDVDQLETAATAMGLNEIKQVAFSARTADGWSYMRRYVRFTSANARLRRLFGGAPHIQETIRYAPQDTLLYLSADCDLNAIYALALDTLKALNAPEPVAALEALHGGLYEQTGYSFSSLADGLGPEMALMADRDPEKELTDGIPLPRFALVAAVRNENPYRMALGYLERSNTPHDVSEAGRVRRVLVRLPPSDGYPLAPAIGFDGRFLVIASQPDYLDKILATGESFTNLASANEYLILRQGLPAQGNAQMFISPRIGEAYLAPLAAKAPMFNLPTSFKGAMSMRVNDPDGSLLIQRTPEDSGLSFWSLMTTIWMLHSTPTFALGDMEIEGFPMDMPIHAPEAM